MTLGRFQPRNGGGATVGRGTGGQQCDNGEGEDQFHSSSLCVVRQIIGTLQYFTKRLVGLAFSHGQALGGASDQALGVVQG